jgi:hypothetical protein
MRTGQPIDRRCGSRPAHPARCNEGGEDPPLHCDSSDRDFNECGGVGAKNRHDSKEMRVRACNDMRFANTCDAVSSIASLTTGING